MFFRSKPVGSYRYLQIVHSVREGKKVRQQVIATLGRLDLLEASGQLERLMRSGLRHPAIRCATSSVPPFSRKFVIPVALKEWGENAPDNPASEPAFEHSGCIDSGCRAVPEFSRLT
jgi:hypothetical protein